MGTRSRAKIDMFDEDYRESKRISRMAQNLILPPISEVKGKNSINGEKVTGLSRVKLALLSTCCLALFAVTVFVIH